MKAISLWQPWAWLIFHGKPVENRDWPTRYRGPLLIHASKTWDSNGFAWICDTFGAKLSNLMPNTFPQGYIVGKVNLIDCVTEYDSPWFFGPYGHVYREAREFKTPIPYRGSQGIFEVPNEIILDYLAQTPRVAPVPEPKDSTDGSYDPTGAQ
jgi:hypothetical protein